MKRNITGKPDGACFGNVLKDVKNTATREEDGSKKVMTVPPYNQETFYPLSCGELMFNPVQFGYGGYWAGWAP